ncbi:MAG: ROK family protein [Candidatus Marinimicrobia bacterium]|nr:ROK family protein [Candidatus Neomarinimicrobiota bacterium]MCF7828049.1 ROK family protein [Candidatus Neomarinimicrobiota bacterium]MCF7879196.1 ROK family protein [Candidatus Neomarinimicrobiota bacterium]
MTPLWGIDLGGTKIEGVVIKSADNPQALSRMRIPTEAENGYSHILNRIALLVEKMSTEIGERASHIGIGTPGIVDPGTGTVKNSNTGCLIGKPLPRDLRQRLDIPLTFENDANCFVLAETRFGCIKNQVPDASVIFGVIMGTGVGGGLIVNDTVVRGKHAIGGEWGHNFLDESGGECYCGKVGCVETVISGSALEKYHSDRTGEEKSLREIAKEARDGSDVMAKDTIERLTHYFGKAIAGVINIVDPDAIVLGGGVGNIPELYTDGIRETKKHVFNHSLDTPFLRPELGDSAGVFGAAILR